MKILLVSNGYPPTSLAGVEQYTHHLAGSLGAAGHQVQVFCREHGPRLREYTVIDGVVDGIPVRWVVNNLLDARRVEDFYRNPTIEQLFAALVRTAQPDVIHFQHAIGLSAGLIDAAAESGIPFLLTLHDYWFICPTVQLLTTQMRLCPGPHRGADCAACLGPQDGAARLLHSIPFYARLKRGLPPAAWRVIQRPARTALERVPSRGQHPNLDPESPYRARMAFMQQTLARCPTLVAPSQFVRGVYSGYGVPAERIRVIPLGLDLARWPQQPVPPASPAGSLRVAFIGTLLPHKGVDVLIRAFKQIQAPAARLFIYGYGLEEEPYEARLHGLAKQDARIQFMGRYDNAQLPALLADKDVLVIPSRWHETFSLVAHEALLAGIPVIASAAGALPEVVVEGRNGWLVPPGDVDALAARLRALAEDGIGQASGGLAGLPGRAAVLGTEQHAGMVEALYREISAGRRRTGRPDPAHAAVDA